MGWPGRREILILRPLSANDEAGGAPAFLFDQVFLFGEVFFIQLKPADENFFPMSRNFCAR
jgi:hypothetical protein